MHSILIPFLAVVAAAFGVFRLDMVPSTPSDPIAFGGTMASIHATMLGFMLAALAVLASINHTHLVAMMHKTGHYKNLLMTLFTGCCLFLVCAVISISIMFGLEAGPRLMATLVGLQVGCLVSLLDIGRKFWIVLTNLRPQHP